MFDFIKLMTERSWLAWPILILITVIGLYQIYGFVCHIHKDNREKKNQEIALSDGVEGQGVIISAILTPELSHMLINGKKSLDFEISVESLNYDPFDATLTCLVDPLQLSSFSSANRVSVKFIPGDPTKVAICSP